jgi:hypothetical protein
VQAARFLRFERVGAAARVEAGAPERFAGVDIADAGYVGLIQQEVFQWALGSGEQLGQARWGEIAREGIDTENREPRAILSRFPSVNATEVAAIGEAEDTFVEFDGDIDMDPVLALIGTLQQFFRICKPEELAVEFEMYSSQPTVQNKQHILAFAIGGLNATALGLAGDMGSKLGLPGREDGAFERQLLLPGVQACVLDGIKNRV